MGWEIEAAIPADVLTPCLTRYTREHSGSACRGR